MTLYGSKPGDSIAIFPTIPAACATDNEPNSPPIVLFHILITLLIMVAAFVLSSPLNSIPSPPISEPTG